MRTENPITIDCDEVVEVVTDYLERALRDDELAVLEHHLETCKKCATYVEQMRQTIAGLRQLEQPAGRPPGFDDLLTAFRGRT
ncbi:MAG: anti-sigma factor family protein [Solirubrobacterales bacterium]